MSKKITFSVFADLHYKKGMYVSSVADVKEIFAKAKQNGAELVLHLGDMCNDYLRSVEVTKAYLKNEDGLDAYGVYGNHELETVGNTMSLVTPLLTNRAEDVIWGTDDGRIGDGSIAYYYFDKDNFRFIATDTNYSVNPHTEEYEHNMPASWGAPTGNKRENSLGPKQLAWLRKTVLSAAEDSKNCIILSHASFYQDWGPSPDAEQVRAIFSEANVIKKNTVVLALNGHYHNNRQAVAEDVVYLDINTVHSGWWEGNRFYGYAEENINDPQYTFEYTEYDQGGNPACTFARPLCSLTMGAQTLFFKDPLAATITVGADGSVSMRGMRTEWMYGIAPASPDYTEKLLEISDFNFNK